MGAGGGAGAVPTLLPPLQLQVSCDWWSAGHVSCDWWSAGHVTPPCRPHGVERLWPVLFHWDSVYWAAAALFATTGGYTASLALMYCPRSVVTPPSGPQF